MPRTSNLFITSPRVGAPPAGEMSCSGFSEETPASPGGWQSELQTPGDTWRTSGRAPSSLLFHDSSSPPHSLARFQAFFYYYYSFCNVTFFFRSDLVFIFQLPLYSISWCLSCIENSTRVHLDDLGDRNRSVKCVVKQPLRGPISHHSLHRHKHAGGVFDREAD